MSRKFIFGGSFSGVDADAQAFITAAGITDPTQQGAIFTLVSDLKGYSIWTKMKALYPFVGGSASSHGYDLITATSVITWNGGVTHNSDGVTTNGTNAYGVTTANVSTIVPYFHTDSHVSIYNKQRYTSGNGFALSVGNTATGDPLYGLVIGRQTELTAPTYYDAGDFSNNGRISYPEFTNGDDSRGFYIGTSRANNDRELYKNSTTIATGTATATGTPPNAVLHIGKCNATAGLDYYQGLILSLVSVGLSLNDTQAGDFRTAVQAFQTTLSRQV